MHQNINADKPLVVTMALPYANGDIHLGHMVEAVQTDIYVRTQKMYGRKTLYFCADDTHGTPIQLNAMRQGITPEELIAKAWDNHKRDYDSFDIQFDKFYSTNSEENREWAENIFSKMGEKNLITKKVIEQYYCEHDKRFLPDRFIKGTCPKCGAHDQYGDNCEKCGATYDSEDIIKPACTLCGGEPVLRETEHFFAEMSSKEEFLTSYLSPGNGVLQDDMQNFVMNWVEDMQPRCISRDAPYFGFKIPGTEDKYFYVWLDAPVGYVSTTDKWCRENGENVLDYWGADANAEVVHFIGKDIVYFHTLLWPVMLEAAGLKKPSKVFVHGFLTVEGEKMSKSRGTFILAKDFIDKVDHPEAAEFIRLYYASKLSGGAADLDFNIEEFVNRVNTTLSNNIGNFQNRTCTFLDRFFDSTVPDCDWDEDIAKQSEELAEEIRQNLLVVNYRTAVDKIHQLGSLANKYFQDKKPWELVKTDMDEAQKVLNTCVNLVKTLGTVLKPIVPTVASRIEKQFGEDFNWDSTKFSLKGEKIGTAEKLIVPLEMELFETLIEKEEIVPVKEEPKEDLIEFPDFLKLKMRVGEITAAEKMKKSKKMMKIQLNDGYKTRQIMSGIGEHYTAEDLVGKKVVFVSNLKPAKLMGQLSEGMILAAEDDKGALAMLETDKGFEAGAEVS
jgi:methionyl-tRNA synthetase